MTFGVEKKELERGRIAWSTTPVHNYSVCTVHSAKSPISNNIMQLVLQIHNRDKRSTMYTVSSCYIVFSIINQSSK